MRLSGRWLRDVKRAVQGSEGGGNDRLASTEVTLGWVCSAGGACIEGASSSGNRVFRESKRMSEHAGRQHLQQCLAGDDGV